MQQIQTEIKNKNNNNKYQQLFIHSNHYTILITTQRKNIQMLYLNQSNITWSKLRSRKVRKQVKQIGAKTDESSSNVKNCRIEIYHGA